MSAPAGKPLWFLDVDGVVNCFPAPSMDQLFASQDWRDSTLGKYRIWWRESVRDFINSMAHENLVEIVWLTTWKTHAATTLAPALGLANFHAVADDGGSEDPGSPDWWKLRRVLELAGDRPFVWTDDHLDEGPARPLVEANLKQNFLIVAPASNPGLAPSDFPAIEAFLRAEASHVG